MAHTVIYTCSLGGYDWLHRPLAPTPGAAFLRFSDHACRRQSPWVHSPVPQEATAATRRLLSRYPKIMAHRVLPGTVGRDADVSVWIDSSVLVLDDITPLLDRFRSSGADMALFRHPSGRTVSEELDFALTVKKRGVDASDRAEAQRARYGAADLLSVPVFEATILFRRTDSAPVTAAMERWWHEVSTLTERDQVSLPYALRDQGCSIMEWDWHFDDPGCRWFRRIPHRPKTLRKRLVAGAHFLGDHRPEYRVARSIIRTGGRLRRSLHKALGR